jgi:putative ABC transport system ATP-binding protein
MRSDIRAMKTPVVASGLTKVYTEGRVEVKAVAGVNLQLNEGEVVGLFGPSGSGKTTLLSMLGCILSPTSGSLRVYGNEILGLHESELPAIRKQYISFIFQGFNLFPALTAYENVMLVLGLKGAGGFSADQRARQLLTTVGLAERMDFLPRDMSGGQKQRVAVARALAAGSPLILADEPTGNLDHTNGLTVMNLLKRLAVEERRCVVVATHDNRIEGLFDRIFVMEDGAIVSETRRSA